MMNIGYPLLLGGFTFTAFDWISDTLRGMRGVMMDMYQVPDKLLALIDMFIPLTIGVTAAMAEQAGVKRAMIPLHRGSAGFMSEEHYAGFYWPSLKALVLGLIDAGITPVVFIEGDYTPRLKFLRELPPKKAVLHFDKVDRKKAKETIGDVACFWGNVPASIMCTGTVQQVKDDVKELIDLFGDNGGLIIDSTMGIPDESKKENVHALTEAVHEFGVY
jgi:uroporphyrinogen-III decarboxylase